MRIKTVVLLAVFTLFNHSISAIGQDCSAILSQGIFDIKIGIVNNASAHSFAQWYCDQQFDSKA